MCQSPRAACLLQAGCGRQHRQPQHCPSPRAGLDSALYWSDKGKPTYDPSFGRPRALIKEARALKKLETAFSCLPKAHLLSPGFLSEDHLDTTRTTHRSSRSPHLPAEVSFAAHRLRATHPREINNKRFFTEV